jgi:short-subunit dehydrogenase
MPTIARRGDGFLKHYGPWALVAGASRGLGAAFARLLAERGFKLVLAARGRDDLERGAAELRKEFGTETVTHALDLADGAPALVREIGGREIGLLVYNAALAPAGPFLDLPPDEHERVLAVNCRTPLLLARAAAERMRRRGRGGIVLVSSLAGMLSGPGLADYAASKAFLITLAESLWCELAPAGVDVVAPVFGAIGTPTYWSGLAGRKSPAPVMEPADAARLSLKSLGRGGSVVPGLFNKLGAFFLTRVLGRKARLRIMGATMRSRNETSAGVKPDGSRTVRGGETKDR